MRGEPSGCVGVVFPHSVSVAELVRLPVALLPPPRLEGRCGPSSHTGPAGCPPGRFAWGGCGHAGSSFHKGDCLGTACIVPGVRTERCCLPGGLRSVCTFPSGACGWLLQLRCLVLGRISFSWLFLFILFYFKFLFFCCFSFLPFFVSFSYFWEAHFLCSQQPLQRGVGEAAHFRES